LLQETNRPSEAEPLMRRHVGIFFLFLTNSDHRYPHTLDAVENYLRLACELKLPYSEILARLDAEREKAGLSEEAFEEIWAEVLAGDPDCGGLAFSRTPAQTRTPKQQRQALSRKILSSV